MNDPPVRMFRCSSIPIFYSTIPRFQFGISMIATFQNSNVPSRLFLDSNIPTPQTRSVSSVGSCKKVTSVGCRGKNQTERRSEQFAGAHALAKIRGGKDEDAVLGAATLGFQADNDALLDPWIILYESAEAS